MRNVMLSLALLAALHWLVWWHRGRDPHLTGPPISHA